jgi:hypothetical protein
VDRIYAYQPKLDRRFIGFCEPHTLVLEFDDRLSALPPGRPVYLFVNGWIEYPYSQTTFAAGQARVAWQPTRIEREVRPGQWDTIAPDAGAPGGMGRMITVDLTGKLPADACRLRITTNLEVYYDQMFLAADLGQSDVTIQSVPLKQAAVRRLGFPLEYSPDGRLPMLYSYDIIQATSPFKVPRGRYTRYGPVEDLLGAFDDRYVILGTGDEIAASFDGTALRPLTDGQTRSFVLVSHAYCKDMDLYTAEPDTVEPLPFRGMRNYPYPAGQAYPAGPSFDRYHARYNTRVVD